MLTIIALITTDAHAEVEKLTDGIYASIDSKMILVQIITTLTAVVLFLVNMVWSSFRSKGQVTEKTMNELVLKVTRIDQKLSTIDQDIEHKAELVVHRIMAKKK